MDILRRFKGGSNEAGTAKDGTKTSKETVPETDRSVTDGGLDIGIMGKGKGKIARTLTGTMSNAKGDYNELAFMSGRPIRAQDRPLSFGDRLLKATQDLFSDNRKWRRDPDTYLSIPPEYLKNREMNDTEARWNSGSGAERTPLQRSSSRSYTSVNSGTGNETAVRDTSTFKAPSSRGLTLPDEGAPLEQTALDDPVSPRTYEQQMPSWQSRARDQSSIDGLDDLTFKRGAALAYPSVPGENLRNTNLVKELDRNRTDKDYHSDNEDADYINPPWSSIDFPEVPGEGSRDSSNNVISSYPRKMIDKIQREPSTLDGSAGSTSSPLDPTSTQDLDEHSYSGALHSPYHEKHDHPLYIYEDDLDLPRWKSRSSKDTGIPGGQNSDSIIQKDSTPFSLAHQAGRVSYIDFSGAEDMKTYQQFDTHCVDTPDRNVEGCSNEPADGASRHLRIGGISSELLAEPESLSEYLDMVLDPSKNGFTFEQDPDLRTLARRVENPEDGTSSHLRSLSFSSVSSFSRWESFKEWSDENNAYFEKCLQLRDNHVQGDDTAEQRIDEELHMRHAMDGRERKPDEDELSDTSHVSAASSIPSVADSIFTMISGSSMSSVVAPQGAGERLVGLLLGDVIIKQACFEALLTIEEERFERNLRRLLRDFSSELRKEAETVQQRHAASFVRFRARNSAHIICNSLKPGRKTGGGNEPEEESENEDSDRSEDEVENLEIFIKSSKAFDAFRTKLRAFVYPSEQKANDTNFKAGDGSIDHDDEDIEVKVTTQDENQVYDIANVVDRDLPKVTSVVKAFNAVFDTIWMSLRDTPPPVPLGKTRVEWQCKCGETIYDDFIELKPGAAEKFKEMLTQMSKSTSSSKSSRVSRLASTFFSSLKGFDSIFSISSRGSENSLPFHQRHEASNTSSEATPIPQDPNAPLPQPQYLAICYRDGRYATRLMQPDLIDQHINSDRALFDLLRTSYQATRGNWTSLLSLQKLSWIKFVQFELYHGELVDVRKVNDMPPPEHVEYRYAPAPPDVLPPIGDMQMMHLFQNPSCAANSPWLMERFPKKLLRPLTCASEASANTLIPGWGIQFLVSWDIPRIWLMSFFFFGLGSVLIGILWCVFKHSIQDAFAVAAYVVAFGTVSVGTVQALLVM